MEQEWAHARPNRHGAECVAELPEFLHIDNHHRGHTALKRASPADRRPNLSGQNM